MHVMRKNGGMTKPARVLRSRVNPQKCLTSQGNTTDGGNLVLGSCTAPGAQFDWVNNSLRSTDDASLAINPDRVQRTDVESGRVDIETSNATANMTLSASSQAQWFWDDVVYRELISEASGNCLDVHGALTANGTNVKNWYCNGLDAQKWWYNDRKGFLHSGLAASKCLDNGGQAYNGGKIALWDCVESDNLKFDWVGNSLRSRINNDFAVDATGATPGSNVLQHNYHGGPNQQWHWKY